MTIKIDMLRCFTTVAQTGNLVEAAAQRSRTQSALSMTLKQLEAHLGGKLFESDRKNRLTPLGEEIYELAQQQLRQFDYSVNAIESAAKSPKGLIRIASVPSVSGVIFPSAIGSIRQRHPGLKVELRDTDTQQVINALVQGHADVGIASGSHPMNGIRQALLFEDEFGLVCAKSHPLALQSREPAIEEVVGAGFVKNNLCDLITSQEFHQEITEACVTVHNTLSLIGMVRTDNWVTILPKKVTQILPGELIFRTISGLADRRPVFVMLRERSLNLRFAEELYATIQEFDWT